MLKLVDRLLSANGIPKLRRITKDRLKFKGKGHEVLSVTQFHSLLPFLDFSICHTLTCFIQFSDVARLLNLYQLWLDDLFPKAKFADGLALIEKAGHSKRMQTMRREWIDEGKPCNRDDERRREAVKAHDAKQQNSVGSGTESRIGEVPIPTTKAVESDVTMSGSLNKEPQDESLFVSDDDEMGRSIPQASKLKSGTQTESSPQKPLTNGTRLDESLFVSGDEAPTAAPGEDLDDLDALLAEEEQVRKESGKGTFLGPSNAQEHIADDFEDEMEAMARFDDW